YVVRFECRLFQILKANTRLPRTGEKVIVRVRPGRSLSILREEKTLLVEELPLQKKGLSDSHAA
ncbi:MAG: hypothetical protein LBC27_09400, partial [Spirochaetaceae bacterium]|nr:hypothetical protein [Spirochaetaceae bacterium]